MAVYNINKRIQYRRGSNGPKPDGSKPPFNLDDWLEQLDPEVGFHILVPNRLYSYR